MIINKVTRISKYFSTNNFILDYQRKFDNKKNWKLIYNEKFEDLSNLIDMELVAF